jgi:hypothetical protein
MLSPTEQRALVQAVQGSSAWRLVYQDEAALLFSRVIP